MLQWSSSYSPDPPAPPTTICERRRQFLMIGAPPPAIICLRAADATLVYLIVLLHFYALHDIAILKLLPQCEIEADISRQQFVSMPGLQDSKKPGCLVFK